MKLYTVFISAVVGTAFLLNGNIHNFTIPKIEGGNQQLSGFQNKKIMVITLPLVQNYEADSFLFALDTLASAHTSTLKVIAVPSFEDGYTAAQQYQLKQWYRSKLGSYIVISKGLHTRKTSGAQQHPLFKWLTRVNQNEVFDIDVEGPGTKFFAGEDGNLYAVLRPHSKISGMSVQRVINMQP